ncbi:hypothetical protein CI102_6986 [Trichoderma harzianum]|nr:hypothetical protein CI102_6986 [Trichoderma harzianum]
MLSNDPNKSRQAPRKEEKRHKTLLSSRCYPRKTTSGYTRHGKLTWEPQPKKDPKFRFSPLPLVSLIVATGGVIRRPCCPGFRKSSPFNQEPACRVITFHRCSGICTKPKHRPGLHATSPMQACIRPSFFSSEPNIEAPPSAVSPALGAVLSY